MYDPLYVYVISLGCSKNFIDTEVIAASLITNNIGITNNLDDADICLINTCAFIPPARDEAEENIEEAIDWKMEAPEDRKIIVSGCLIQWDKNTLTYPEKYPEIDLWLGIDELETYPEKIQQLYSGAIKDRIFFRENPKYLYDHKTPRVQLTSPHYANIKIAEGCNNRCSYCTIPEIRGNLRSRAISSIISEAESLLSNNVKELLIIAQDITAFGKDRKNSGDNLANLIKELDKIPGDHWLRLHYLHPEGVTDELIETIAAAEHVIPYLDIPIQHASNNILSAMNRRISAQTLNQIIEKLRKNIKDLVLRTTFLVGFPGETEKDFNILKDFIEKWKFERFGVFPFYPEAGTVAAKMPGKVPFSVAEQRAEILSGIYEKNSEKFNKGLIGQELEVIIDQISGKQIIGRTYMDSPEIDNQVIVRNLKRMPVKEGNFYRIKITGAHAFELNGIIL